MQLNAVRVRSCRLRSDTRSTFAPPRPVKEFALQAFDSGQMAPELRDLIGTAASVPDPRFPSTPPTHHADVEGGRGRLGEGLASRPSR